MPWEFLGPCCVPAALSHVRLLGLSVEILRQQNGGQSSHCLSHHGLGSLCLFMLLMSLCKRFLALR